jgi:methylmalonyl-CoA mutase
MDQNDEMKLFTEFPPVSTENWEEKIHEDLKGGDYEKKLVWKPIEGLNVRPYYRMEDLENIEQTNTLPGEFPYLRGNNKNNNDWEIRQEIDVTDIQEANKKALEAIKRGAGAITYKVKELAYQEEMTALLKGIDLSKIPIHFTSSFSYSVLVELLLQTLKENKINPDQAKGSFNFDSISYYLLNGEFYNSAEDNFNEAACLIKLTKEKLPQFKVININGQHFHNAGANAVQELAWSLASASEYFSQLSDRKITPDDIATKTQFTIASGSDYFLEIARVRAARMLYAQMAKQYGCTEEGSKVFIHCVNSNWNKTVFDPWINMLRTTTEAMSAAIGGANAITNLPLNETYRKFDPFAERIARNTQIVLKEESNLDKVVDPSSGSYYIEKLTDDLAKLVWEEFQKVETMGGLLKAFESGYILQEVDKTCKQRDMDIATRKTSVLGTNIFPNLNEQMLDEIDIKPSESRSGGLKLYRGAEAFERLRLSTEKYIANDHKRPAVLLIGYGNLAMRKARANFATNFFGVAGYEILEEYEAIDVRKALLHIMKTDPSIIVYCSSDEEYNGLAVEIMKAAKDEPSVIAKHVIAGYPKDSLDNLKNAGADDFIHTRTNLLESLTGYQKMLGIL